jgi:hypothetical protein
MDLARSNGRKENPNNEKEKCENGGDFIFTTESTMKNRWQNKAEH